MKKIIKIPFDKNTGQMLTWTFRSSNNTVWKDNFTWEDTLVFNGFSRGQSAVRIYFLSTKTGIQYQTFMVELAKIIPHIVNGYVNGTFTFCKRGDNYGIRLDKPVGDKK